MNTTPRRIVVTASFAIAIAVAVSQPTFASEEPIAKVEDYGTMLAFDPVDLDRSVTLTVSGRGVWQRQAYGPAEYMTFEPYNNDGDLLPDGIYAFELRMDNKKQTGKFRLDGGLIEYLPKR